MKVHGFVRAGIVVVAMAMPGIGGVAKADVRLIGSGASFPFPIYATWFKAFSQEHDGVIVDYQAKGSGAGIQDFINHTVDFAASDAAMNAEEIAQVPDGVVLLPMTAGEIVLAYNLPEAPEGLKLGHDVYPAIFAGEIVNWNDPRIAEDNPDVALPDLPITVVRRSDSSGTTYVFTRHLAAVDANFKQTVGIGKTVQWPQSDKFVAAPKNDGVTATVKQTPGAIGYIEYGYAKLTKTPVALLQNSSGTFVEPGEDSGEAALASVTLPPDLVAWIDDPEGKDAYPIATFTWMLFYKQQDPEKAQVLRELIAYCLGDGQKIAPSMGYIPLPENVVEKVSAASEEIK